jgi:hypothetical protein
MMGFMSWNEQELSTIAAAGELHIGSKRQDGTKTNGVIIWSVRVGDDLYVRSVNGTDAPWYRGTRATQTGQVQGTGFDRDVVFVDVDATDPVQEQLDHAYGLKYGRSSSSVASITSATARAATIRVLPA